VSQRPRVPAWPIPAPRVPAWPIPATVRHPQVWLGQGWRFAPRLGSASPNWASVVLIPVGQIQYHLPASSHGPPLLAGGRALGRRAPAPSPSATSQDRPLYRHSLAAIVAREITTRFPAPRLAPASWIDPGGTTPKSPSCDGHLFPYTDDLGIGRRFAATGNVYRRLTVMYSTWR
jgi:hypothetical protein